MRLLLDLTPDDRGRARGSYAPCGGSASGVASDVSCAPTAGCGCGAAWLGSASGTAADANEDELDSSATLVGLKGGRRQPPAVAVLGDEIDLRVWMPGRD